ncbi:hypothetical protein Vau01_073420 [Virgisporangium aurantiacum]|uniref:Uncharacterized protein n=2 Tax=Virgisporangium aurantiacum TaxID=175570 RepID=A0A8J3ZDW2_9ACTN|nr:hypothetical protein Vau01_073420 [Virgisporangium aurantiacum]
MLPIQRGMSLGLLGVVLVGMLVVLSIDRGSRVRTVMTGVVGLMLGLVIAGSNGVLVEPAHNLVDSVRAGLTAVGEQIGGADQPTKSDAAR